MFNFLKKKPQVLPTFAPLVTDMHSHLLPRVDDGSNSLEMSMEVLAMMKQVGFEEARLTPHYQYPRFPNEEQDILRRFESFCAEVDQHRGERAMPLLKGVSGEYRVDSGFDDRARSKELLTFHFADPDEGAPKGLLLVEFSLHQPMLGVENVLFDRQMEGYDLILAHPERYPYYDSNSKMMEQLKEAGVYFQVNILSLEGFYGDAARKKAFTMIENGWVEFLGTDMHNTTYSEGLRRASVNKSIIKLMEKEEFLNAKLVR
ncbi:MAG: hypothetical protein K5864_06945 [Bacteroidales bacterium]|nr:hypothetical protein [Bacteroidales bacterium]